MIADSDTVTIRSTEFVHGQNDKFEYYAHTDAQGMKWEVWRHLRGPISTKTWFASVSSEKQGVKMLNTAVVKGEEVIQQDPLYHINPYSSQSLLEAMVPLIEAGEWPE